MEFDGIIAIVLTAVLTTVGTFFITRHTHRLSLERDSQTRDEERDQHARYLAVRVVCALDPFALRCCDVVGDHGVYDNEDCRHTEVEEPKLVLPSDVDWKCIPTELLYRILNFPNEIDSVEGSISAVVTLVAGPPDYEEAFEERSYGYAKLGLAALDLAKDIRAAYGLPNRDHGRWDPRTQLERAYTQREKWRRVGQEAAANIVSSANVGT